MKGCMATRWACTRWRATVTAVDSKTGMVDVTTEGIALKVHFPPSAMANLKTGNKITLHLRISKP